MCLEACRCYSNQSKLLYYCINTIQYPSPTPPQGSGSGCYCCGGATVCVNVPSGQCNRNFGIIMAIVLLLRTRMQSTPSEELARKCFNAKNCAPFAYTYAKYASGRAGCMCEVREECCSFDLSRNKKKRSVRVHVCKLRMSFTLPKSSPGDP